MCNVHTGIKSTISLKTTKYCKTQAKPNNTFLRIKSQMACNRSFPLIWSELSHEIVLTHGYAKEPHVGLTQLATRGKANCILHGQTPGEVCKLSKLQFTEYAPNAYQARSVTRPLIPYMHNWQSRGNVWRVQFLKQYATMGPGQGISSGIDNDDIRVNKMTLSLFNKGGTASLPFLSP